MADGDPEEPAEPDTPKSRRTWIIAAAVVLVLAGVAAAVTRGDGGGPSKSSAVDTCHQLVRDKLKAPATARFDADKPAKLDGGTGSQQGTLFILGTVDAENGFSANVRNTYICIARVEGDHYNINPADVVLA